QGQKRPHDFALADGIQRLALEQQKAAESKTLRHTKKPAARTSLAPGHRLHYSPLIREQRNDFVRLGQAAGAKHHRLGLVKSHRTGSPSGGAAVSAGTVRTAA